MPCFLFRLPGAVYSIVKSDKSGTSGMFPATHSNQIVQSMLAILRNHQVGAGSILQSAAELDRLKCRPKRTTFDHSHRSELNVNVAN
jgi:hypothetical protein